MLRFIFDLVLVLMGPSSAVLVCDGAALVMRKAARGAVGVLGLASSGKNHAARKNNRRGKLFRRSWSPSMAAWMRGGSESSKTRMRKRLTPCCPCTSPTSRKAFSHGTIPSTCVTDRLSMSNQSLVETSPCSEASCCACHSLRMVRFSLRKPCVSSGCSSHVILAGHIQQPAPESLGQLAQGL